MTAGEPDSYPSDSESVFEGEDDLNTIEDLRKGIVRSAKEKSEITILIIGETGTGKTTFLSFLGNVLNGNPPEKFRKFYELSNEAGGSKKSSQTNSAALYEFSSTNGILFRILDTPGLADTRGISKDQEHKTSIAMTIKEKVSTVDAVLILANGTQARLTHATDYAITTLSSMFPKSLAKNIGFLFTNVSSPLSWNFEKDALPEVLRENEQFLIDNPVAMQEKFTRLPTKVKKAKHKKLKADVEEGYQKALELMVEMFDWLDGLEPQPTNGIVEIYEKSQDIERRIVGAIVTMKQAGKKKSALEQIMQEANGTRLTMEKYRQYESTVVMQVTTFVDSPHRNTICLHPDCYSNCHENCGSVISYLFGSFARCRAFDKGKTKTCVKCHHAHTRHRRLKKMRWGTEEDQEVTIDEDAKRNFENAKTENERQELLKNDLKSKLDTLDSAISKATYEIADLLREYSELSLSGSFAGQISKSINLLQLHLGAMRDDPSMDLATIQAMEKGVEEMKEKLSAFEKVKNYVEKKVSDTARRAKEWGSLLGAASDSNGPQTTRS